ncbi:hypothetical protein SAMN05444004_1016 [Jannaschia faecimaris]|uniref:Uncharacterized protein n=1 Tax=Jannaschia faecimaris TaxID=1244108 RepID=A0A1H3IGG5_9RHOB|nr:hypothetical protein SAMN05444004_1016 [Jannaschia faecimaris]
MRGVGGWREITGCGCYIAVEGLEGSGIGTLRAWSGPFPSAFARLVPLVVRVAQLFLYFRSLQGNHLAQGRSTVPGFTTKGDI